MRRTSSAQIELFATETSPTAMPQRGDVPPKRAISKERLPTNTTTDRHPVHRWFNFIAGFSPEFVHQCCLSVATRSVLLDPFGGCGTAPLVAKERGMDSISFDPHPIFARIARAKLATSDTHDVRRIEKLILSSLEDSSPPPNPPIRRSATVLIEVVRSLCA